MQKKQIYSVFIAAMAVIIAGVMVAHHHLLLGIIVLGLGVLALVVENLTLFAETREGKHDHPAM